MYKKHSANSQPGRTPTETEFVIKQANKAALTFLSRQICSSTEASLTTMKAVNKPIDREQGREKKGGAFAVLLGRKDVKDTCSCQELTQSQLWTASTPVTEQGCKEALN